MKQKSGPGKAPAEQVLKDIRRQTRRQYSAEEKIRIVLEGLRGEENISELCRREGIAASMYYGWSKEFLEAGKRRLAGDTARAVPASDKEAKHECTLSGRIEPNRAGRTDSDARRRQACRPQAQAGADFAGGRCRLLRRGDCPNRPGQPFQRRPDKAPLRGRQSGAGLVRRAASGRGAQADRQGGGPAGGDRMR